VGDRIDALGDAFGVGVGVQDDAGLAGAAIAERDHLAEFPAGVHVQQRDRRTRRIKGLEQQVQEHRAVLADRIQHHRIAEPGRDLAQDVDAFRLEAIEVGQRGWFGHRSGRQGGNGILAAARVQAALRGRGPPWRRLASSRPAR
jgi:hypothetical protein